MGKIHKLTKGGQTIYPATVTDAVVDPNTRKSLTAELSEIDARISGKKEYSVGKNIINPLNLTDGYYLGKDGNLKQLASFCVTVYIPIKNNTQYHISKTNVGGAYHVIFDGNLKVLTVIKDGTVTTPENAAYIRLSISKSHLGTAQMELGSTATSYEPYTDNYDNEQKFAQLEAQIADNKTGLETKIADKKNVSLGKNLFNKSTVQNGYYIDSAGNLLINSTLSLSNYIKVNPNTSYYIQGTTTGGASNVWFDKEFNFIEAAAKSGVTTSPSNAAYIRLSVSTAVVDNAMFFEGSTATSYEPYTDNYDNEQKFAQLEAQIADNKTGLETKIVLPSSLYFKANRQNNLYYKQAIKCSCYDNFDFSVSNPTLKVFDRQLSGVPVTASVFNNKLTLRKSGRLLQELQVKINILTNPSSHKIVKILDCGDSISDLGGWQAELKNLLEEDNVTVEYIGTMINRIKTTGSDYAEDIWGEVQSGGNMSFITEPKGAAKILTVSGITELPVTGYPGTSYLDNNNISWVVRGFKLTAGSDGKYGGKLKLGKFSSDPNYGDGTEDDTSGTGNFPSSGTITKTQSVNGSTLAGDATIAYTSADDARYNPFWNPSTDELDFQYYFDYWGFNAPDIFIMQWGYNEVKSYEDVNSDSVQTAKLRAKQIIDKFHSQYPNTKFIFGLEIYGVEVITYSGSSSNNNSPKKYSVLSFAEEIISLFEGNDDTGSPYSNYVTLVPVYALMDSVYGYGPLSEKSLCDLYSAATTVLQNGRDGIHPSYASGGLREIGRAYEPVVLAIMNL